MSFKHNKGNFTVELAIIGVFFSLLIAFSGDVIIKLSIKGKLDRMAYSAASIVKERKQLFDDEYQVENTERDYAYNIVSRSLQRTISDFSTDKFGFSLDVYTLDADTGNVERSTEYPLGGISCTVSQPNQNLFISTTYGRSLTLYQATLCYKTDNWFGSLIGETYDRVQSYAVLMGR